MMKSFTIFDLEKSVNIKINKNTQISNQINKEQDLTSILDIDNFTSQMNSILKAIFKLNDSFVRINCGHNALIKYIFTFD